MFLFEVVPLDSNTLPFCHCYKAPQNTQDVIALSLICVLDKTVSAGKRGAFSSAQVMQSA